MPAFSKARLSGPAVAVKGSLRRASPALDRAHRTLLNSPNPLEFQKRQLKTLYVHLTALSYQRRILYFKFYIRRIAVDQKNKRANIAS